MRFTPFLAILPALTAAQEQVPLGDRVQGWFNKAKSYLPTATPVVPIEKVVEQKVQEKAVTPFNLTNWQSNLVPSAKPQDWLLFVTGGNKTCFGQCEKANKAFNESVLLFSADPTAPNLGYLDCESNSILCSAWIAGVPSVWHFQIPQAQDGPERPETPLHIVSLNTTTVTASTIYEIHSKKTYEDVPAYEGPLHPTDGWVSQNGLSVPMGYGIWAFSLIPSWLFMVLISFVSRTFMSRRVNPAGAQGAQGAQGGRPN